MKTFKFKFGDQISSFENYLDFYLKNKSTDCILYSEDCSKFKVHKELFGQTDFLREILSSTKEQCCGTIEVLCPCSKEELGHLVNFLYDGQIHCEEESESLKIIENLQNIFGFQRNLVLKYYPNEAVFTSDKNIEAITVSEEVFENILDNSDVISRLVSSDQGKEDHSLDYGEKKKKSKKISGKKVKGSSMKKHPKQLNCNDCGRSFISKGDMQRHINAVHLKLKPYECEQCQKSFTRENDMQKHVNMVHLKIRPFECEQCQKSFSKKDHLKDHINAIHLKIKPYECHQCKMSFAQKCQLNTHVKIIHQQIKAHECKDCQLHFSRKQDMQTHVNVVHLKVKPFECDQCKETFTRKYSLKLHRQSNCKKLKKKGFKCRDCDSSFVTRVKLERHVNKFHNENQAFEKVVCIECEESFEDKDSLEYHMNKIHLKVKPYVCDFCKKAFHLEANLKTHLRKTHNDEAN